jgi:hypothetical protein
MTSYLCICLLLLAISIQLAYSTCPDAKSVEFENRYTIYDPPELVTAILTDPSKRTPEQIVLINNKINEYKTQVGLLREHFIQLLTSVEAVLFFR